MNIKEYFEYNIRKPESLHLEYKATPIPSRTIAQIIASFANSEGGGMVFGIRQVPIHRFIIEGLSSEFLIQGLVHKAISLLQPQPKVFSDYFTFEGKQLFGVVVEKSDVVVLVEGEAYKRINDRTLAVKEKETIKSLLIFPKLKQIFEKLETEKKAATSSKKRFLDHYISTLSIYQPLLQAYFPADFTARVTSQQGKVFNRILFSSCVDNFETYLSALLYEIYLSNPDTLKGGESVVKVAEVLACADMEEFVQWFAAKRVGKLQKGSVEGFLSKNPEISSLGSLDANQVKDIEQILQIRHLYTHRNGIVDEGFLYHFRGQFQLNEEHQFSLEQMLDKLEYLVSIVSSIDNKAVTKYGLSTQDPA